MDADTRAKYAIRCIVVSTQSGVASIGRAEEYDSDTRDRLQRDVLERGNALLNELEGNTELMRPEMRRGMRAARSTLAS